MPCEECADSNTRGAEVSAMQESSDGAQMTQTQDDGPSSPKRPRHEGEDVTRGESPVIMKEAWSDEEEEEEEDGEGDDVSVQVNKFFAELDIDQSRQRKRLLTEGVRVCVCL